jgi:4-hydroxy-2-oxoheptanedioate aldolase
MRPNPIKRKLREGKPAVGTWLTLGNPLVSRFLARAGWDWLTVDTEHNAIGIEAAADCFAAVADAGNTVLARVPSNRHDHIKRVLDTGAHGVVVPMVNTRQEAFDAVSACLYPPAGTRSVGGAAHALNFAANPTDYYARANQEILVVLQCEHIDPVKNFDQVYSVPGIDAVFVGPNDLAASMRSADGKPPHPDAFKEALAEILAGCKRNKVAAGIHTFGPEEARMRIEEGWQFIAVGSELKLLLDMSKKTTDAIGLGKGSGEMAKY